MNDTTVVHVRHGAQDLLDDTSHLHFSVRHASVQVSARAQFHDNHQLLSLLLGEGFYRHLCELKINLNHHSRSFLTIRLDNTPVIQRLEQFHLIFELINLFHTTCHQLEVDNFKSIVERKVHGHALLLLSIERRGGRWRGKE